MLKKNSSDLILVDPYSEIYINLPNMSIAYAATVYDCPVIDQHVMPYPADRFLKYSCDTLGISVRSFALSQANKAIKKYGRKYPETRIKSLDAFDVQCCYPFLNLNEKIELGIEFSDELPFPKYELFDSFNFMASNWEVGLWHYPIMTSLGCPFQCTFCAGRNRVYKTRSVENCIEELKQAKDKYNIKSFEIIDDVFNLDKARVLSFCKAVMPLKLSWLCSNGLRADRFDEDQAHSLKQSGCHTVGFGIETTDDHILSCIKKGEKFDDISRAVNIAKKYFIEVKGYFIIGLPGSSYESDMNSINWAIENGIKPVVSYYVPETDEVMDKDSEDSSIFYGSKAKPESDEYSHDKQKEVYSFAKKNVKEIYSKQKLPLKLIINGLRAVKKYNLNSMISLLMIAPRRLFNILFKGEVQ